MQNEKNTYLFIILSATVLILWTWLYKKPIMEDAQRQKIEQAQSAEQTTANIGSNGKFQNSPAKIREREFEVLLDEKISVEQSINERLLIKSKRLKGSINLRGARFDNLYLLDYREGINEDSKKVVLFAPKNSKERYIADFGWVSSDTNLELPNSETLWYTEDKRLKVNNDVTLSWKNKQNILFTIQVSLDKNYMFNIKKKIKNLSNKSAKIASYGRVNRLLKEKPTSYYILHEGPIGVFDGILSEPQFEEVIDENNQHFEAKKAWLGLTDKYWLSAVIPDEGKIDAVYKHKANDNGDIYNVGFVGQEFQVKSGGSIEVNHKLFAGAKEVALLDRYSKQHDIELFDRAVDFGWYYFLTKPFFFILKFLNQLFGNYGLAIMGMTVLIKLALLPLAAKSYKAMARIKKLQPQIEAIKKKNKDNKMAMNKDVMELYKSEKVNPASGCLPMLIQIPIFFSLYKVLFVTIDMRHQPFYGWIKDLSAPDPTSVFNLFGLLPFEIGSGILMIGIWPILMGLTMVLQQKLGPKISDPTQARVMKILPFVLIFVFAAFPAGLLIYWTWNNILSTAQQYYITKKVDNDKS